MQKIALQKITLQKITLLTIITLLFISLYSVPPIPNKTDALNPVQVFPTENFGPNSFNRTGELPQNVLVLRAEFTDIKFDLVADFPDEVAHDEVYFDRMLFHLSAYLHDASHGLYEFDEDNYTIWETVFTVPNTMAYYGDDDNSTERIAEFVRDLIEAADTGIDFSNYDSFVIFHAGAGQEADLSGNNTDNIWSTFITRKTLRIGLDPENEDFLGIPTDDGVYLTEFNICPETEWQPDNDENSPKYSMFGVFAHNFGHQIGLPTLFDNDSSNGGSFGIGNFALMGTGAWNAKGFVPPLPCAWSRYYLGWEDDNIQVINEPGTDFQIEQISATDPVHPTLYKIPITDKEYFLIENIQYNPDNSTLNGFPNFTFELLADGDQDYYDPPNDNVPRFNFMKNSYLGCEWNFWLPGAGYGDPPIEEDETFIFHNGSGLFIWHIDENVIEAKFQEDFESNSVNGYAAHKGVDLEEADGFQHMDNRQSMESLGCAYDSFREGNNSYFGNAIDSDGAYSSPTAVSYYGGTPLAITDVGMSGNIMTFSVNYGWQLDSGYEGENPYPAALIDFDNDGEDELFRPDPDGTMILWKGDVEVADFISPNETSVQLYAFDEFSKSLLVATKSENEPSRLYVLNNDIQQFKVIDFTDLTWASHSVVNVDENSDYRLFLPLTNLDTNNLEIQIYSGEFDYIETIDLGVMELVSNLILSPGNLYCVTKDLQTGYQQVRIDLSNLHIFIDKLNIPDEEIVQSALIAPMVSVLPTTDEVEDGLVVKTESKIYLFSMSQFLQSGFPVELELHNSGLPSIADLDGNGVLDILVSGSNSFNIIYGKGNVFTHSQALEIPDSTFISSGVLAFDADGDGILDIAGNLSQNRLCVWQKLNINDFILQEDFPVTYAQSSRNYPLMGSYPNEDGVVTSYIFTAADDGKIYRQEIAGNEFPIWKTEFANLQRTAYFQGEIPNNNFVSSSVFVKDECYIYPNPFGTIFSGSVSTGIYREDTITIKLMITRVADVELKVFDIAGNIIFKDKKRCDPYDVSENSRFFLDAKDISSGAYFAVLKAKGEVLKLKFALEK